MGKKTSVLVHTSMCANLTRWGWHSMFIIDRFEGDWAVIEYDRTTFNLPRSLLPPDVKAGDVITISISVDQTSTKERRQKSKEIMKGLFES